MSARLDERRAEKCPARLGSLGSARDARKICGREQIRENIKFSCIEINE
jgi:hypothetical protein